MINVLIFIAALSLLLLSANFFTKAAEKIGAHFNLPQFVIGVFIVGIGTSLPELVSGILSVKLGTSEILPGNIIGANISNLLLVTGLVVIINKKEINLGSAYIYIDLHFLIGSILSFYIIAYDGIITFSEAWVGLLIFLVYSFYLIKSGSIKIQSNEKVKEKFPFVSLLILSISSLGIYFGAEYTVKSVTEIATLLFIPPSVIALTVLSLGTTLPEIVVNIVAIKQGKGEMAIGNVLGSCIFNTLMVAGISSMFGNITVPNELISFALPVMAGSGLLFYLLKQDKKLSVWEGILFVLLYILFLLKIAS